MWWYPCPHPPPRFLQPTALCVVCGLSGSWSLSALIAKEHLKSDSTSNDLFLTAPQGRFICWSLIQKYLTVVPSHWILGVCPQYTVYQMLHMLEGLYDIIKVEVRISVTLHFILVGKIFSHPRLNPLFSHMFAPTNQEYLWALKHMTRTFHRNKVGI